MKGKLVSTIFALPFAAFAIWMGATICVEIYDAWRMEAWDPAPATLYRGGYTSHRGSDSTTYEAFAEYEYGYNGQTFRSNRVGVAEGADNIGDYHQVLGQRLEAALRNGGAITVYVNPDDPSQAIYDRSLRWGLIGFKLIFVLVFGGFGFGLLIYLFLKRSANTLPHGQEASQPWLANDSWQGGEIRSNSKISMYAAWGFAAIWNLISAPLPFVLVEEVFEKQNWLAGLGFMFPMVGIGLIYWAVQRSREWRKYGVAPLRLDPFPGSIDGDVGGSIDVNTPYASEQRYTVTLTCLRSYVSGSGKNRSRKESPLWQEQQIAQQAYGPKGVSLSFCFSVPPNLEPADARRNTNTYHLWRLTLESEAIDGVGLNRSYDIPVYPTGERSIHLSGQSGTLDDATQEASDRAKIVEMIRIDQTPRGKTLRFPIGRHLGGSTIMAAVGMIFAVTGWFLWSNEQEYFIGGVFTCLGTLVTVIGLYTLLNSLEVTVSGGFLTSTRGIVGIPIRVSQIAVRDFAQFRQKESFKSQTGGKHTIFYALDALDRGGKAVRVAESLRGANQARAAEALIAEELGLEMPKQHLEAGAFNLDVSNALSGRTP